MNLATMYTGHCNFARLRNVSDDRVFIYGSYVEPGGCIIVPVDLATTAMGMVDAFEIESLTTARDSSGPVFGWDAQYAPTENFTNEGDVTYQDIRRNGSLADLREQRSRMLERARRSLCK